MDLRLAYVQHPFPAQGQTTDTTHVLVSELATREGSYVALTRARDTTTIYASQEELDRSDEDQRDPDRALDRVAQLAELMGQPEPKVASITTPLAHETPARRRRRRRPRRP
jgi:superfamily I DNA/RNA helicase